MKTFFGSISTRWLDFPRIQMHKDLLHRYRIIRPRENCKTSLVLYEPGKSSVAIYALYLEKCKTGRNRAISS